MQGDGLSGDACEQLSLIGAATGDRLSGWFGLKCVWYTSICGKTWLVGELANLTREKMRKRRQSPTCVSRAPSIKWSLQSIVKILQWCSKYHGDDQNTTVMLRILQWCSKYYIDAPDITDAESKKREVSGKILCRDTQELVGDRKGTDGVCAGPHNYTSEHTNVLSYDQP